MDWLTFESKFKLKIDFYYTTTSQTFLLMELMFSRGPRLIKFLSQIRFGTLWVQWFCKGVYEEEIQDSLCGLQEPMLNNKLDSGQKSLLSVLFQIYTVIYSSVILLHAQVYLGEPEWYFYRWVLPIIWIFAFWNSIRGTFVSLRFYCNTPGWISRNLSRTCLNQISSWNIKKKILWCMRKIKPIF